MTDIALGPIEPLMIAEGDPDVPGLDLARVFGAPAKAARCPYPAKGDDGSVHACAARGHCHCYFGRAAA